MYIDIDAIRKNWDKRRCELPVMIAAGLYKPSYYEGTSINFASENFQYCGRKVANDVIRAGMKPFYSIAEQQINAQQTLAVPMNNIRAAIAKSTHQFSDYMNYTYVKYANGMVETLKSIFHMQFAMKRLSGITASILYMMISGFIFIGNIIQFGGSAIKTFLGILTGLMIIMFPILSPLSALISTVTAIMSGALIGVIQGVESSLCCDPSALVRLEDGTTKPLSDISIGDRLYTWNTTEPNIVQGILKADGRKTPLVAIDGVRMSGSHSVQFGTTWVLAKNHPNATICQTICEELLCLNTTLHEASLVGTTGTVVVSDWEEVSSLQGKQAWIDWVHLFLNGTRVAVTKYPTSIPLISPSIQVTLESGKQVPIHTIQLGDRIRTKETYTTVKAIYTGTLFTSSPPTTPEWISDGVWIYKNAFWATSYIGIQTVKDGNPLSGIHLITEDETFFIQRGKEELLIRDFTEVGLSSIDKSYTMIQSFMNKK